MLVADAMLRALVSEDSDLGRWALGRALEGEGFEVHAVLTWAEASAWLRRMECDLVLAEVSSASEAIEVLGDVHRCAPGAHLVLLADEDTVDELRRACGPAPDVLAKPVDLEQLVYVALSRPARGGERLGG